MISFDPRGYWAESCWEGKHLINLDHQEVLCLRNPQILGERCLPACNQVQRGNRVSGHTFKAIRLIGVSPVAGLDTAEPPRPRLGVSEAMAALLRTARLAVGVIVAEEDPGRAPPVPDDPPWPPTDMTFSSIPPFLVGVLKAEQVWKPSHFCSVCFYVLSQKRP